MIKRMSTAYSNALRERITQDKAFAASEGVSSALVLPSRLVADFLPGAIADRKYYPWLISSRTHTRITTALEQAHRIASEVDLKDPMFLVVRVFFHRKGVQQPFFTLEIDVDISGPVLRARVVESRPSRSSSGRLEVMREQD